jgi:adenylate kinase family enzyme
VSHPGLRFPEPVRRIAVTGPIGAGKSRLADELGRVLGIRVLHLDSLFWKPGWVATPADEFDALQRRELAGEAWIVDAQYDDMLPDWVETADTVVFVDVSPLRALSRVARRRLNRDASVGVPSGTAPAPFHRSLWKFLRNQWLYRRKVRPELLAELERERAGRRVVVLRRGEDARTFLSELDSPGATGGTF